jgi:hypothetical protein
MKKGCNFASNIGNHDGGLRQSTSDHCSRGSENSDWMDWRAVRHGRRSSCVGSHGIGTADEKSGEVVARRRIACSSWGSELCISNWIAAAYAFSPSVREV